MPIYAPLMLVAADGCLQSDAVPDSGRKDSGAVSASGPAGDQSSDGASSGDLDSSDTDDWVRAYVPSLGARAHAQDTAPPRAGAGAKKTKKRSKLRRSGGKGF